MRRVLVFVGTLVPEEPRFVTRAFSYAGNSFQGRLLRSVLVAAHFDRSVVWSVVAIPGLRWGGPWVVYSVELTARLGVDDARTFGMINITPIKQLWLGLAVLFRLFALRLRMGRSAEVTVLQYNTLAPPLAFTWLGSRLIGARIFVSANDMGAPNAGGRRTPLRRVEAAQDRALLPRVDGVFAATERIVRDFGILPARALLIDAGVPDDFPEAKPEGEVRLEPERPLTLGFAGTLEPYNGVLVLLEALERHRDLPFQILVAGRGSCVDAVRRAAVSDPRIVYLGFISQTEVFGMYGRCDALLNLRLIDSHDMKYFFPSKLIECLATGVPVISTPVAHATAEFGDTMFVVSGEGAEPLAQILRAVAATDVARRRAMGRTARERVLATRRWSILGQRAASLMSSNPRGR